MPARSDTELVQSARSGDEKAFERLVEKYRVRISATIAAFISNPQDREDIGQETIINAYRNLHQLSKPERFRFLVGRDCTKPMPRLDAQKPDTVRSD